MRSLGLSLCLVACTLENPAFFAPPTDGATTVASTASTSASGGLTTGATAPTTSTSTSGPDATTTSSTSTGAATTMNLSDTAATTDAPGTTSTTDPSMTASSDPGETSSSTGDPMACYFDDKLGPYVHLLSLPDLVPIPTAKCSLWTQTELGGRLTADTDGFMIHPDVDCGLNNLPDSPLRFPVPLPEGLAATGKCVTFKFGAHPGYEDCMVSGFTVWLDDKPTIAGSFGLAPPFYANPLQVVLGPKNVCTCPGCCGMNAPDPDLYKYLIGGTAIGEGVSQPLELMAVPFVFTNLRSHVHAPECQEMGLKRPDWLHLDWIAAQVL